MIVITGSVTAKDDCFDEIRRLNLEHIRRSRREPGCISHAVHVDCENPSAAAARRGRDHH
jgi:quinol monooxygenase YgiN